MLLRMIEEFWSVDRKSGKSSLKRLSDAAVTPSVGAVYEFAKGNRRFVIDEIHDDSLVISARYENDRVRWTQTVPRGKRTFYKPRSFDGGYQYYFYLDCDEPTYSIAVNFSESGEYDAYSSKFFGSPAVPSEWAGRFYDDIIFLAQIRLSDIAPFDIENRLPHTGYLYFFLDAENFAGGSYDVWVEYYGGEPDTVLYGFNEHSPIPEGLQNDIPVSFSFVHPDADCTKLLGLPSGGIDKRDRLLLQYDTLMFEDLPFLSDMCGYAYVFFNEDEHDLEITDRLYTESVWEGDL